MHKFLLILILIILGYSCNSNNTRDDVKKPINSPGIFSDLLIQPELILQHEVEQIKKNINQKLATKHSDSTQKALEEIYYWDQVFRDSIQRGFKLTIQSKQKHSLIEKMNEKIVLELLAESGWPKTKDMTKKAQESICLVVIHSNNKELKKISSSLLDKAFYLDSSMNNELYACTYDNIEISFGRNYKYGTLRFKKDDHHDSTISKINKNRRTIGLTDI